MRHFLARMLSGWRRDRCARRTQSRPADEALRSRQAARALAQMLDRAMQLDQWEQAQRIAVTASRLAHDHAVLAERIARLKIMQGQREEALAIMESCGESSASLRLLHSACLVALGRRRDAHLDLHEWSRRAGAPLQARVLLALLNWRLGDHEGAIAALVRNLRQIDDPNALEALTLLSAEQGRHEQCDFWAARLLEATAAGPESERIQAMLRSVGAKADNHGIDPPAAMIHSLRMEIIAHEPVLAALAEAQRHDANPAGARLLMRGIEAALHDLDDRAGACELLSMLAHSMDDAAAAYAWSGRAAFERRNAKARSQVSVAEVKHASGDARGEVLASIGSGSEEAAAAAMERAA